MTKTLLITGASSGIGSATARLFAEKDWNVVATMRDRSAIADLPRSGNVLVTRLDVEDRDSIESAVEAGIARFGRIDALVNNAGFGQYGVFEAVPRERIQKQFDVNVFGLMDVTRALLPHFRQRKDGLIVNVSSGAGIISLPLMSAYCASKFALEGFSESLAYELASLNIAVKLVVPQGSVAGTRFNERSAKENAKALGLADYDPFVRRTKEAFARTAVRQMSAHDVAAVIYTAATDGTRTFRYLAGDDSPFIKARREMSDQDYIDYMHARFASKP